MAEGARIEGLLAADPEAFAEAFISEPAALSMLITVEAASVARALAGDPGWTKHDQSSEASLRQLLASEPAVVTEALLAEPAVLTRLLHVEAASVASAAEQEGGDAVLTAGPDESSSASAAATRLVAALRAHGSGAS